MTHIELMEKLRKMHKSAYLGDETNMIRLFGILYAEELKNFNTKDLRLVGKTAAGKASYGGEIRKGVLLAKYVEVKPEFKNKYRLL